MIGLSANSGKESWLQLNEVKVLGFEFDPFDSLRNSLPFGNHCNSLVKTIKKK